MKNIIKEKKIKYLVHFTRAKNLPSIFIHGLLPKTNLVSQGIDCAFNDEYRHDDCENALCMSVEFPNYRMFFKLRKDNIDVKWAVLLLDASILYEFDCAFCSKNAGCSEMYTTSLQERKGKEAFRKMFDELPSGLSRKELGIGNYQQYTTDPQAEVLVFDQIPVQYIRTIVFEKETDAGIIYKMEHFPCKTKVIKKYFRGRMDWRHW